MRALSDGARFGAAAMVRVSGRKVWSHKASNTTTGVMSSRGRSLWSHVPRGPEDAILGVTLAYQRDPNKNKINLGVGAYRGEDGKPFVLESVRTAERKLLEEDHPMEYLPVAGDKEFVQHALRLAYGDSVAKEIAPRVASIQTLSGTGACRMAGALFVAFPPHSSRPEDDLKPSQPATVSQTKPLVYLPTPSWANHAAIFTHAGCAVRSYRYYNSSTRGLDEAGMIADLDAAPPGAVVLLHACAHNPTGVDPSDTTWHAMSDVMMKRGLVPLFDMAYQGFTSGDAEKDAAALRMFVAKGHRVVLAQSFSKNFGLYGHRVGALSVMTDSNAEADAVQSQLKILARPMYSNPPIHGVRVVNEILREAPLETKWREEMRAMAERIIGVRKALREGLESRGSAWNWSHVTNQRGMFCYSGLSPEQVDALAKDHSVYLTRNGRISMAGVTRANVDYLADAIHAVTS
eukprot:CAMPEP_0185850522 /NCGR_PEP_ID=MMETSP1354-20130828/4627_1 /TAXON_ID=708628 /ORGANISM="Erythrolobus madagascarensis, Strain CCMP3276" /LENGTH=460 /DNA_ID=CAMNT_0028551213 /DNA_START=73 /DNA_END=1455 /DNA_ORIENTATION=+